MTRTLNNRIQWRTSDTDTLLADFAPTISGYKKAKAFVASSPYRKPTRFLVPVTALETSLGYFLSNHPEENSLVELF